jgi:hypothetical protein
MKKININIYVVLALMLVLGFESCKKDYKAGGTATEQLAGEWVVTTVGSDGSASKPYALSTYNTAANRPDSMWVDDGNNYYGLKARVGCSVSNLTFSVNGADELYYGVKVTITGGKIMKNAAIAPSSKDKTDSIYFKAVFTGDPTTYTYSGYKRTGFAGDDPQ